MNVIRGVDPVSDDLNSGTTGLDCTLNNYPQCRICLSTLRANGLNLSTSHNDVRHGENSHELWPNSRKLCPL